MKRNLFISLFMLASVAMSAQTLDRMQWFNEPESWTIENDVLTMDVKYVMMRNCWLQGQVRALPDQASS